MNEKYLTLADVESAYEGYRMLVFNHNLSDSECRKAFLTEHIFDFDCCDDELAAHIGEMFLRVVKSVQNRDYEAILNTYDYKENIIALNMLRSANALNYGTSIRGARFEFDGKTLWTQALVDWIIDIDNH